MIYSLNFPIKKPFNTVPPPPPPCITHTTPTSTTITSTITTTRIQRRTHTPQCPCAAAGFNKDVSLLSLADHLEKDIEAPPSPASRPPRTPGPHARCSGIPSCRAHTATGLKSSDRRQRGAFSWTFDEYLVEAQNIDSVGNWTSTV
ncbi:uncharacterized protein LOC123503761 [Portunus trituberculatus]|uniref:uncharacterized protein LOC123503761 n=1 Tax=Portunus trituberculatus TaxID=210409 RepID=UPI001E1D21C9|nr:uncharacterized protein LOC123503761 [Portunus trituberculatus]